MEISWIVDDSRMGVRKPKPKPKADDNTAIVWAAERLTDSEPVRGEDLLSPRLATKLRAAKTRVQSAR